MEDENKTIYDYHSQPDKLIHWADINRLPWAAFSTIKQLAKTKQEIPPSLMKTISLSPKYACSYACDVVKGPWPPGEAAIAKSGFDSARYAVTALRGKRFPLGEPAITSPRNPEAAYQSHWYARDVIKGPWPEGEAAIASKYFVAIEYVKNLKKEWPWPPADQAIIEADAKGDFLDTEEIKEYIENCLYYSYEPVKLYRVQNMATGEAIDTDEKPSQDDLDAGRVRIIAIREGRRPKRLPSDTESIMMKYDIERAIDYCRDFPEAIPKLEKITLQASQEQLSNGIIYAEKILKRPWPEFEKIILQNNNIDDSNIYNVMRSRFNNAEVADNYAKKVLKRPWHEAEHVIAPRWSSSQDYLDKFPDRYENFLKIWKENPDLLELWVDYGGDEHYLKISHNKKYNMLHIRKMMSSSMIKKLKEKVRQKIIFREPVSRFYANEPNIALYPQVRQIYLEKFPERKTAIEFLVNELRSRLSGVVKI